MELKIAVPGQVYLGELSTAQVPVASGAGTIVVASNIATFTTAAAHGLTLTPAAGTAPNYFVTFTGVTGITGVGTFNGPVFRVLTIPTTTTLTVFTTITAGVFTAGTIVPIFIPTGAPLPNSIWLGGPLMTGVAVPPNFQESCTANVTTGANAVVQYNPDNTSIIQDSTSGPTLAVTPVFRTLQAVSAQGQIWFDGVAGTFVAANGGAGTTRWSVVE